MIWCINNLSDLPLPWTLTPVCTCLSPVSTHTLMPAFLSLSMVSGTPSCSLSSIPVAPVNQAFKPHMKFCKYILHSIILWERCLAITEESLQFVVTQFSWYSRVYWNWKLIHAQNYSPTNTVSKNPTTHEYWPPWNYMIPHYTSKYFMHLKTIFDPNPMSFFNVSCTKWQLYGLSWPTQQIQVLFYLTRDLQYLLFSVLHGRWGLVKSDLPLLVFHAW